MHNVRGTGAGVNSLVAHMARSLFFTNHSISQNTFLLKTLV